MGDFVFHILQNFWLFLFLQILAHIGIFATVARYKKILLAFLLINVICVLSLCLSYSIFTDIFSRKFSESLGFLVMFYVDLWCTKLLIDYAPILINKK